MSILEIPELSPGRARAVVRHLISLDSQRQRSELLEALLSPPSLPVAGLDDDDGRGDAAPDGDPPEAPDRRTSGQTMIAKVLSGGERMGLVTRDEGEIALNPALPREARSPGTADSRLPLTLAELVFSSANATNHELARVIAWYLMQDPLQPPHNETVVHEALGRTPALKERFGLTNVSYGQFEDWVCFLGFAWAHISPDRKRAITPDPTPYLRSVIDGVFAAAEADSLPFAVLSERLARECPVLEGGALRREVEVLAGSEPEPNTLSPATSQAWLRLEDERRVELVRKADAANPVILNDGGTMLQVAEVRLLGRGRAARRRS